MADPQTHRTINSALGAIANGVGIFGLTKNSKNKKDVKKNSDMIKQNENLTTSNTNTINAAIEDISVNQLPTAINEVNNAIDTKKESLENLIENEIKDTRVKLDNSINTTAGKIADRTISAKSLEETRNTEIQNYKNNNTNFSEFNTELDEVTTLLTEKEGTISTNIETETLRATAAENNINLGLGSSVYQEAMKNCVEIYENNILINGNYKQNKSGWLWRKKSDELYIVSTCNDYIGPKLIENGVPLDDSSPGYERLLSLLQKNDEFSMIFYNMNKNSYQKINIVLVSCCFRNNIGLFKIQEETDKELFTTDQGFSLENLDPESTKKGKDCFLIGGLYDNLDNFSMSKGIIRENMHNNTGNESILIDIISGVRASSGAPFINNSGQIMAMKQAITSEYSNTKNIINSGNIWVGNTVIQVNNLVLYLTPSYTFFTDGVDPLFKWGGTGGEGQIPTEAGDYLVINIDGGAADLGNYMGIPKKISLTGVVVAVVIDGTGVEPLDLNHIHDIVLWRYDQWGDIVALIDISEFLPDGRGYSNYSGISSFSTCSYIIGGGSYISNINNVDDFRAKSGTLGISHRIMEPVLEELIVLSNKVTPNGTDIYVSVGDLNGPPYYRFYDGSEVDANEIFALEGNTKYTFKGVDDTHPFAILEGTNFDGTEISFEYSNGFDTNNGITSAGTITFSTSEWSSYEGAPGISQLQLNYKCTTHQAMSGYFIVENAQLINIRHSLSLTTSNLVEDSVATPSYSYYIDGSNTSLGEVSELTDDEYKYIGGKIDISVQVNTNTELYRNFGGIHHTSTEIKNYLTTYFDIDVQTSIKSIIILGMVYTPLANDPNFGGENNEILIKFGSYNHDQKTISSATQFITKDNYATSKLYFLTKTYTEDQEGNKTYTNEVIMENFDNLFGVWNDENNKLHNFMVEYYPGITNTDQEIPNFVNKQKMIRKIKKREKDKHKKIGDVTNKLMNHSVNKKIRITKLENIFKI